MPTAYNFVKGVDFPQYDWLSPLPVSSNPGAGNAYDGSRYIYWALQSGSTTAAGTTGLYRYDTWTDGWQYLAALTNSYQGLDLEYDPIRNVLYIIHGNSLTTGQIFNLNTTSVTVANVAVGAWALGALPTLPIAAGVGSSLTMPDDLAVIGALTPGGATAIDTGEIAAAGSTATSLVTTAETTTFGFGMVGLYARFTSGALAGQRRLITAVPNKSTLTVASFGATPAAGDDFVVEVPEAAATGGTTTTVVATGAGWTTNLYANSDVVFLSGANAGTRRRIASNTADTLTLTAAVTGNPRTGTITAPGAGDVFRIVPSSDFLYYQPGGATGIYRLDVAQTTGAAWSGSVGTLTAATGGGGNSMYAGMFDPFSLMVVRGATTATVYRYTLGPGAVSTVTTFIGPNENFGNGASSAMMHGKRRLWVQKEGSPRIYLLDLTTGIYEPGPYLPYANPAGYDGKRSRFVRTPSGVEWMYHLRAGGQELFRVPVEWL